jgi:hypothetical protein
MVQDKPRVAIRAANGRIARRRGPFDSVGADGLSNIKDGMIF